MENTSLDNVENIIELCNLLRAQQDNFYDFLLQERLLHASGPRCVKCKSRTSLYKQTNCKFNMTWRCIRYKCRRKRCVTYNSFFFNFHLPVDKILIVMFNWCMSVTADSTAQLLRYNKDSVLQIFEYCRDLCSWQLLQVPEQFIFGGPGVTVEIYESAFDTRKYNTGSETTGMIWVLGIYCRHTRRGYMELVSDRSIETLMNIIKEHVREGTEIYTDLLRIYSQLKANNYIHLTVNHSKNYKDPDTGACTNQVKGWWGVSKRKLRSLNLQSSPNVPRHLDTLMWRNLYAPSGIEAFRNLLKHVRSQYKILYFHPDSTEKKMTDKNDILRIRIASKKKWSNIPEDTSILQCVHHIGNTFSSDIDADFAAKASALATLNTFKRSPKSENYRQEGNAAFEKKEYLKALHLFNKSISYAHVKSSELSLGYANRSAVLLAMGKLTDCISDLKRAQDSGYPTSLKYKLFLREGQCRRDLGQADQAKKCFSSSIKALELSKLNEERKEKVKTTIVEEEEKRPCEITETYKILNVEEMPSLSYGQSDEVPCASSAIGLRYNEDFGRLFEATRDIKIGDILMVEEPFAAIPHPPYDETLENVPSCSHCQALCFSLLPCPNCVWAMFCSEECLKTATEQYHPNECLAMSKFMLLENEKTFDGAAIVFRMLAKLKAKKIEHYVNLPPIPRLQSDKEKRTQGFNDEGKYNSNDFLTIFRFESHFSKLVEPNAHLNYCLIAVVMSKCLNPVSYLKLPSLSALILQLYLTVKCNSLGLLYQKLEPGRFEISFASAGSGLFPAASLFNHSCNPNATFMMYGNKIVIRALHPISKGEQVTVPYRTPWPFDNNNVERKLNLKQEYRFDCKCEVCVNDFPSLADLPEFAETSQFKCLPTHVTQNLMDFLALIADDYKTYTWPENRKSISVRVEENIKKYSKFMSVIHQNSKQVAYYEFYFLKLQLIKNIMASGTIITN